MSTLDGWSGWGLLKRRSWAPLIACFAGGLTLAGAGWLAFRLGGHFVHESAPSGPAQPAVSTQEVVTRVLSYLPFLASVICRMILLGALFRRDGRGQFPPGRTEFTLGRFWTGLAAGAMVSSLYNAVLAWILHEPASP